MIKVEAAAHLIDVSYTVPDASFVGSTILAVRAQFTKNAVIPMLRGSIPALMILYDFDFCGGWDEVDSSAIFMFLIFLQRDT
jgi:hypothetical protein